MDKINKNDFKYLERPWLREHEILGLPETFEPYPGLTHTQYHLDRPAKKYPNNIAIVQFDYEMTFKELKNHVDRLATALADLGVKKGDVVATVLPTCIQGILADFAIPEIGGICTFQGVIDSVDGLVDKWTRAGVKTVICSYTNVKERDVLDKVKEAGKKAGIKNIIVTKTKDYSQHPPEHEEEEGVIWLTDLIKRYPPNPPKVDIDPKNDVAVLFFTGGTTGTPKGVMHSHRGLIAHSISSYNTLFPVLFTKTIRGLARVLMPLPMFHVYGHGMSIIVLSEGFTLLLVTDPRDTKEFVRMAKKYHPPIVFGVPTHFMKVLKEESAEGLGMISLSGSAALAPEVHKAIEEKTGSLVGEGYGLSEFAPITHTPSFISLVR
ncbi:MAG TPA: acyl--CoA ligase, partial [Halobacteria archaeon]|nr:acyl--CoA ligase [Halobacteria archaeon]